MNFFAVPLERLGLRPRTRQTATDPAAEPFACLSAAQPLPPTHGACPAELQSAELAPTACRPGDRCSLCSADAAGDDSSAAATADPAVVASGPAVVASGRGVQIEAEALPGRTAVAIDERWLTESACARRLGQQLTQLIDQRRPAVLQIDLARVQRLASEGLNQLIQVNCHARDQGVQLVLVNLNQPLANIFQLTRLDRLFAVERL